MSTAPTARIPRQERRAQVLEAARSAFVELGYYATAMDDIAERAGVSKPILYQHFSSKLELYLDLLSSAIGRLQAAVDGAAVHTRDNKVRVRDTVAAYFAFVDDPDGCARLVFQSDMLNEPEVRSRVEVANAAIARRIAQVIAEDTGLGPDQALLLASGMAGMAEVAARTWLADPDRIPRDEAVDLVSSLAWRGIRGFPLSHPTESDAR